MSEVQIRDEVALFADYLLTERGLAPLTIRVYIQAAQAFIAALKIPGKRRWMRTWRTSPRF